MKAVSITDSAKDICNHWDRCMFEHGGSVPRVCIGLGSIRNRSAVHVWREVEHALYTQTVRTMLGPVYYGALNP